MNNSFRLDPRPEPGPAFGVLVAWRHISFTSTLWTSVLVHDHLLRTKRTYRVFPVTAGNFQWSAATHIVWDQDYKDQHACDLFFWFHRWIARRHFKSRKWPVHISSPGGLRLLFELWTSHGRIKYLDPVLTSEYLSVFFLLDDVFINC